MLRGVAGGMLRGVAGAVPALEDAESSWFNASTFEAVNTADIVARSVASR